MKDALGLNVETNDALPKSVVILSDGMRPMKSVVLCAPAGLTLQEVVTTAAVLLKMGANSRTRIRFNE